MIAPPHPVAPPHPIKEAIRAKALALGFDVAGFAPAVGGAERQAALTAFLAQGRQGEMGWMSERAEQRADPQTLWPEVRSILVLGVNYGPGDDPLALAGSPERGRISVYARNQDYHDLIKKRLKALGRWLGESYGGGLKVFVDTAPVMEKPLGQSAGLGWQGRHTNLVSRSFGSWLFLSEVFLTLDLPPDPPQDFLCGRCTACGPACPTGALDEAGRIEARRCIAYLTIEHKGSIPAALRPALGNRIYGCDDCLAVCPWNKFARPTQEPAFLPRAELTAPRLADLADLNEADFRALFAGSPIKRIGWARFLRNVLIALGNSGNTELLPSVRQHLKTEEPLVRAMALWALARLDPAAARHWAAKRRGDEQSAQCLAEIEVILAPADQGPHRIS